MCICGALVRPWQAYYIVDKFWGLETVMHVPLPHGEGVCVCFVHIVCVCAWHAPICATAFVTPTSWQLLGAWKLRNLRDFSWFWCSFVCLACTAYSLILLLVAVNLMSLDALQTTSSRCLGRIFPLDFLCVWTGSDRLWRCLSLSSACVLFLLSVFDYTCLLCLASCPCVWIVLLICLTYTFLSLFLFHISPPLYTATRPSVLMCSLSLLHTENIDPSWNGAFFSFLLLSYLPTSLFRYFELSEGFSWACLYALSLSLSSFRW